MSTLPSPPGLNCFSTFPAPPLHPSQPSISTGLSCTSSFNSPISSLTVNGTFRSLSMPSSFLINSFSSLPSPPIPSSSSQQTSLTLPRSSPSPSSSQPSSSLDPPPLAAAVPCS